MLNTVKSFAAFRLGDWLVQRDLNQLVRGASAVRVEPKAMEVLCALAARPEQTVARETLLDEVWNGRVVVDEALSRCIAQLRQALEDDARQPRYIQTIPKRGYRLLLRPEPADPLATEGSTAQPSRETEAAGTRHTARRWFLSLLLILTAVAAAFGTYAWQTRATYGGPQSIAVLPFANLTGDTNKLLICEGLSESLVATLIRVPALKVRALQSSYVASRDAQPRAAGRRLNVEAVVEGSVRSEGDSLRIAARLVRVDDGIVLWAREAQGRASRDVLKIQDDIAQSLLAHLHPAGSGDAATVAPRNETAYRLYLEGRHLWNQRTHTALERAVERFEQAIDLEPDYAQAHAAVGEAHLLRSFYGGGVTPTDAAQRARVAAHRALQLDERLSSPHAVLASIYMQYDWDWRRAESEFKLALQLDPNNATAHQWYGELLQWTGRFDEAREQLHTALQIDPLSLVVQTSLVGPDQWSGRYEAAAAALRRVLELDPNFAYAIANLGLVLEAKGDLKGAIEQFEKAQAIFGAASPYASLAHAYAVAGHTQQAHALLQRLLERQREDVYISPFSIAVVHMGLGDRTAALQWLERALASRDDHLVGLAVEPRFAALRGEPRFDAILRQLGLRDVVATVAAR